MQKMNFDHDNGYRYEIKKLRRTMLPSTENKISTWLQIAHWAETDLYNC